MKPKSRGLLTVGFLRSDFCSFFFGSSKSSVLPSSLSVGPRLPPGEALDVFLMSGRYSYQSVDGIGYGHQPVRELLPIKCGARRSLFVRETCLYLASARNMYNT